MLKTSGHQKKTIKCKLRAQFGQNEGKMCPRCAFAFLNNTFEKFYITLIALKEKKELI